MSKWKISVMGCLASDVLRHLHWCGVEIMRREILRQRAIATRKEVPQTRTLWMMLSAVEWIHKNRTKENPKEKKEPFWTFEPLNLFSLTKNASSQNLMILKKFNDLEFNDLEKRSMPLFQFYSTVHLPLFPKIVGSYCGYPQSVPLCAEGKSRKQLTAS